MATISFWVKVFSSFVFTLALGMSFGKKKGKEFWILLLAYVIVSVAWVLAYNAALKG